MCTALREREPNARPDAEKLNARFRLTGVRLRDTSHRILDGEEDLNALLPENYKPSVATLDQQPLAA